MYDYIIAGAGYAGAVSARILAEKGKKVLILEARKHIGGNAYDEKDERGILIHTYGPHIFHTSEKKVYDFLSRFTEFVPYHHKVLADVYGKLIPVPFNLNSLYMVYDGEKAKRLEELLISEYGKEARVPVLSLKESKEAEIRELAEYVYENIFLHYTMKQWGVSPDEIDPAVTARVPVILTREDGYFTDTYQAMPKNGFTELFKNMLNCENIEIRLNCKAEEHISLSDGRIYFDGREFDGEFIYTGMIDELFNRQFGILPYRSLNFVFENYDTDYYQEEAVINYTVSEDYTRISEFKRMTGQKISGTAIVKEYPVNYEPNKGMIPYYAVLNDENLKLYGKYGELASGYRKLRLLGRLAEYKYYNMDAITKRAMELTEEMI